MSQQTWPSHWPTNWNLLRYFFDCTNSNQIPDDGQIRQLWIAAGPEERALARALHYIPEQIKNMPEPTPPVQLYGQLGEDDLLPPQ